LSKDITLAKVALKLLLKRLDEKSAENPHCRRMDGTLRAWFHTRAEAEAFEADPANVSYHGDVAHLCQHCGYWHLSRPHWLEVERWTN
jgi:hypothetical protein